MSNRIVLGIALGLELVIAVCQVALLVDRLNTRRRLRRVIDAGSGR